MSDVDALFDAIEDNSVTLISEIEQGVNESVEQFYLRFDKLHKKVVSEGLASRDISVSWFARGLKKDIQTKLRYELSAHGIVKNLTNQQAVQAVHKCYAVALAVEAALVIEAKDDRNSWRSRSQSFNKPASIANAGPPQFAQRNKTSSAQPASSRDEKLALIARKYNMSVAEVTRHFDNHLCFHCHENTHSSWECSKKGQKPSFNLTEMEQKEAQQVAHEQSDLSKNC